jgi:uncharacterized membrane protein SirB2
MTTKPAPIVSRPDAETLLRRTLRANGVLSGVSGLLFVVGSGSLTAFVGLPSPWILIAIGLSLLGYAALLFKAASPSPIDRHRAILFTAMDTLWVAGSAILLITGWIPITPAGKWAVIIVADIVAVLAVLQFLGLRPLAHRER